MGFIHPKSGDTIITYLISAIILTITMTVYLGEDDFILDIHGHHCELQDGYAYCNHRICLRDSIDNNVMHERIPDLDRYCETDDYILTVKGWTHCYILHKATDTVEGPMTRQDFENKCKEYAIEFIEEPGYVGTTNFRDEGIPITAKIAIAILILAIAVPVFRYGNTIERVVCHNIVPSTAVLCTWINIFTAIFITTDWIMKGDFFIVIGLLSLLPIAAFFLSLIAYSAYKRHFKRIGHILRVIVGSAIYTFLSLHFIVALAIIILILIG